MPSGSRCRGLTTSGIASVIRLPLLVRTWNVFHGNALPPRRRGYLREMIELVCDGPAGRRLFAGAPGVGNLPLG